MQEANTQYTIEDIINKMKKNNRRTDTKLIMKAYNFANSFHKDHLS